MSRKRILIILACLVVLGVCFYVFTKVNFKFVGLVSDKTNQPAQPAASKTEAIKNPADVQLTAEQIEENQAAVSEVIKQGNLDQCSNLDGNFKAVCEYNILINQAVDNNDETVCARINDELYKKSCSDLVAANKKPETEEAAAVGQETVIKTDAEKNKETILSGTAYNDLIVANNEGKLTEPIFNEYIKLVAYADQPELCWELSENLRQECLERAYIIQAKKADDIKICDKIPTPAWREECYAQVLTRRAAEQDDSKICEEISDAANREKCLSNF